jgi:integrase/recombinase XerD
VITYRRILNNYCRWKGDCKITKQDYDRYIMHLRKLRHKQNGIATTAVVLRNYAEYLDMAAGKWQKPPAEVPPTDPLRKNEFEMLLNACKFEGERFILLFLIGTGLRVAEFVGLRWSDIDMENHEIVIRHVKGHKGNRIKMTKTAVDAITGWMKFNNLTPEKAQLNPDRVLWVGSVARVEQIVREIADRARLNIRAVHPHLLRHTFAVEMVKMGMPLPTLSKHLGHASITSTQRYLQYTLLEAERNLPGIEVFSSRKSTRHAAEVDENNLPRVGVF